MADTNVTLSLDRDGFTNIVCERSSSQMVFNKVVGYGELHCDKERQRFWLGVTVTPRIVHVQPSMYQDLNKHRPGVYLNCRTPLDTLSIW